MSHELLYPEKSANGAPFTVADVFKRILPFGIVATIGGLVFTGVFVYAGSMINGGDEPSPAVIVEESDSENDGSPSPTQVIKVDIQGGVYFPGVVELEYNATLSDAIEGAGGVTPEADMEWISRNLNQAARLTDGTYVYIKTTNDDYSDNLTVENCAEVLRSEGYVITQPKQTDSPVSSDTDPVNTPIQGSEPATINKGDDFTNNPTVQVDSSSSGSSKDSQVGTKPGSNSGIAIDSCNCDPGEGSNSSGVGIVSSGSSGSTNSDQSSGAPQGVIKKSSSGICHDPSSSWYDRTTNFTPYSSINECLASGGRLPKS